MAEWDQLVECLSVNLVEDLRRRLWQPYYGRLHKISAPSSKLVYLHLLLSGSQTFTGIRRSLHLSSRTVDKALKELLSFEFIFLDDYLMYHIMF